MKLKQELTTKVLSYFVAMAMLLWYANFILYVKTYRGGAGSYLEISATLIFMIIPLLSGILSILLLIALLKQDQKKHWAHYLIFGFGISPFLILLSTIL
jgi:hypothetical protein